MVSNFNFNSTFCRRMSSRQKPKKHLNDSRKKLRKRSRSILIRDLSFARPLRFVLIFCPCACHCARVGMLFLVSMKRMNPLLCPRLLWWADYDTIAAFCAASNSTMRKKAELKEVYGEFKFFLAHCDRRHNLLSFKRCRVPSCACMRNHPSLSTMFVARLQQMGDVLPSPNPDPQHPGHYATWQQMAYDATLRAKANEHQPTAMLNGHGACAQCRWVFTSKEDKAHHNRLRHPASGQLLDE